MIKDFNFLFNYLEKIEIAIDKSEFVFQMQSHPDFPSLLSIVDTLSFFNIDNVVVHVKFSDIPLLPNRFITLLTEDNREPELTLIQRIENRYFVEERINTVEILLSDLESRWNGICHLIEKTQTETGKGKKNKTYIIMGILSLFTFLFLLFFINISNVLKLFLLLPVAGILFSIAALKDLFGVKNEIINKFCNMIPTSSCGSLIGSKKWKIFKFINFSDLSMIFFVAQFLGFMFMMIAGDISTFFVIQQMFLYFCIPIILLSLYYQNYVEKKWCPICLIIILIILLESGFVIMEANFYFKFSFQSLSILCFVNTITILIWLSIKSIFIKQKELKEEQLKSNRFQRNYEIFKNTLVAKKSVQLPYTPFVLGNGKSNKIITIITNPYCKHCASVHEIICKILHKFRNEIQIQIIFKIDLEFYEKESLNFLKILIQQFLNNGGLKFEEVLTYWFDKNDTNLWMKKYKIEIQAMQINEIYTNQNNWCNANGFNYTPALFINGYEYPKTFNRDNLEYYINDLIDDNF